MPNLIFPLKVKDEVGVSSGILFYTPGLFVYVLLFFC